MEGDYAQGGSLKHRMRVAMSEDDCPERTRFLRDLEIRKGRPASTWREVLGYRDPESGQNTGAIKG
jgi:hypothetical protein